MEMYKSVLFSHKIALLAKILLWCEMLDKKYFGIRFQQKQDRILHNEIKTRISKKMVIAARSRYDTSNLGFSMNTTSKVSYDYELMG